MTLRKILSNNFRFALLVALSLTLPRMVHAADFVQGVSREGGEIGLTQTPASQTWDPTPVTVYDAFFGITPPSGNVNDVYITGTLKLNDRYRINYPGNIRVTVTYDIELYDESDALVQTLTGEVLSISYYTKTGYVDHSQKIYRSGTDYHKAVVSITGVESCLMNDDGTVSSCNSALTSLAGDYYKDISMEWQCTSVRSIEFDDQTAPTVLNHLSGTTNNPTPVCADNTPNNIIRLAWGYVDGAESYDVEWLFLDIPPTVSPSYALPSASQNFPFDWRNATRVNVTGNFYDVPLLYPTGIIVYRIRGIGLDIGSNERLEGKWSRVPSSSAYMDNLNVVTNKFVYCGMERGLNWTASLSLAEEGKHKGVVAFVDGIGHTRQTITTLSTDENTIVAEPSLDHMGRPAVNYLPVPVRGETFAYFPAFNGGFGADVYDIESAYPTNSPVGGIPGTDPSAVLDFYSSNNPFINPSGTPTPYEAYLASLTSYTALAGNYPFTQTRMMNDGSGRPHSSSGVGEAHMLGGGHDTRYYYGTPGSQAEVDRLFGSEAGFVSYYKKNMVVDPNGQISVSYLDGYGRTVATALAGTETKDQLVPISDDKPERFSAGLLGNNALMGDGTLTATKDIVVGVESLYSFSYSIPEIEYQSLCVDDYSCRFEFLISVKDDEGNEYSPDADWKDSYLEPMPYQVEVTLPPGKYTITKILRNREATVTTILTDIDGGLGTSWDETTNACFVPPFVSGCFDCETQCVNAYKYDITYEGNTYTIYRNLSSGGGPDYTTNATVQTEVLDPEGNPIYELISGSDPLIGEANGAIEDCQSLCGVTPTVNMGTECEMKRILLIRDLLPDGQYFENRPQDPSYSGVENAYYDTGAENDPLNRNAWLEAYAADLKDDFGALLNPSIGSPTWEDIRANWGTIDQNDPDFQTLKDALLPRHPEYCLWNAFCGAVDVPCECKSGQASLYETPGNYETIITNTQTDADAKDLYLFAPTGIIPVISGYSGTFSVVDYFDDKTAPGCFADPLLYCNRDSIDSIQHRLENHLIISTGGGPVSISAWYLIEDPESLRTVDLTLGSHPVYPDEFVQYMQVLHGSPANPTGGLLAPYNTAPTGSQMSRWQYFRSIYMFHRMQLRYNLAVAGALACMDCAHEGEEFPDPGSEYVHPLCFDVYLNNQDECHEDVDCTKLPFFSAWDYDDDGYVDVYATVNPFNFTGMEIRYPYIGLLTTPPTPENLQADHCETNCSSLATQWINQLQNGIRSCVTQGVDANDPSLVTTPAFVIPESDKQMLRAYFINICTNACQSQASSYTYTHDYTSYPFSSSGDWSGPHYDMGAYYSGNIIQNVDDVVNRYMEYNGVAEGCPVIVNSIPVGGGEAPDVNELSCSCDNLAYFISSHDDMLNPDYVLINPTKWDILGVSAGTVFDFSEIRAGLEAADVSPINLTDLQGLNNGDFQTLILHWLASCNQSSIPDITLGHTDFGLPNFINCADNAGDEFPAEQTCAQTDSEQENNVNSAAFANFRTTLLGEFESGYRSQCLEQAWSQSIESFTMSYELQEYHYTLYYYDQAGNLVKTVPPAGVNLITDGSQLTDIETFRQAHHYDDDYADQSGFYWPAHTKITNYRYNAQNQVVQQTTPDAGTVEFFYDALGRLVLSRSAQQKDDEKMSYTLFDAIGRIVEVGEIGDYNPSATRQNRQQYVQQLATTLGDPTPFEADVEYNKTAKTQMTLTKYDRSYMMDGFGFSYIPFDQQNLRNRVASTLYYAGYPDNDDFSLYDNAIHYSYDIHGNVQHIAQDIPALQDAGRRFLVTDYAYDLVSGKVNEVHYMKGFPEEFSHYYRYDADNRITAAYTSKNGGIIKELEAKYFYYPTGPLARVELGRNQVQGMDYAYTALSWLKGINADDINTRADIGSDAYYTTDNLHSLFGMDAAGFTLGYYGGDYRAIGTVNTFEAALSGSDDLAVTMHPNTGALANWGLYNGNIAKMATAGLDCDEASMEVLGRGFQYDQLNRIMESSAFTKSNSTDPQTAPSSFTWNGITQDSRWHEEYTYDPDGNISSLLRDGDNGAMDLMYYRYTAGTNQLEHIDDYVPDNMYTNIDVDNQLSDNYLYDLNGNLIYDRKENIDNMVWSVYGKVKSVVRTGGSGKTNQWFGYNPGGQRIIKINHGVHPDYLEADYTMSFYALDAQGNIMAIYDYKPGDGSDYNLTCTDQMIYGTSRIGMLHRNENICKNCVTIDGLENSVNDAVHAHDYVFPSLDEPTYDQEAQLGTREYEFTNHLGNILTTVADRKTYLPDDLIGSGSGAVVFEYRPEVLTSLDYYTFGMRLPGRGCPEVRCTTIVENHSDPVMSNDCSSTSAFSTIGTGLLTINSGRLRVRSTSNTSGWGTSTSITSLVEGYDYSLSFDFDIGQCAENSHPIRVRVKGPDGTVLAEGSYTTSGSITLNFTGNANGIGSIEFTSIDQVDCSFFIDNILLNHIYAESTVSCEGDANMYRFGFNGQEKDNDIYGEGNAYTAEYWEYDPRIGRRWNLDPVPQIGISNYACFYNSPIIIFDRKGDKGETDYTDIETGKLIEHIDDGIDQTVLVDRNQYEKAKEIAASKNLDVLGNREHARVFTNEYERQSKLNSDITFMKLDEKAGYIPPPRSLPGFPDAEKVKPKGGRPRWRNDDGDILEWDGLHGEVERYNGNGKHKGVWSPEGEQTGEPVKGRKVEPILTPPKAERIYDYSDPFRKPDPIAPPTKEQQGVITVGTVLTIILIIVLIPVGA